MAFPPHDEREGDQPAPQTDEGLRSRIQEFIPDIVKRTFLAGLGAVFTTEEGCPAPGIWHPELSSCQPLELGCVPSGRPLNRWLVPVFAAVTGLAAVRAVAAGPALVVLGAGVGAWVLLGVRRLAAESLERIAGS